MNEVIVTKRSKRKIISPDKNLVREKWEWAKNHYDSNKTFWDKIKCLFKSHQELIHPDNFKIFYCKIVNSKVVEIGKYVNGSFKEVFSFNELEKLSASRYINQSEYNKLFGIEEKSWRDWFIQKYN